MSPGWGLLDSHVCNAAVAPKSTPPFHSISDKTHRLCCFRRFIRNNELVMVASCDCMPMSICLACAFSLYSGVADKRCPVRYGRHSCWIPSSGYGSTSSALVDTHKHARWKPQLRNNESRYGRDRHPSSPPLGGGLTKSDAPVPGDSLVAMMPPPAKRFLYRLSSDPATGSTQTNMGLSRSPLSPSPHSSTSISHRVCHVPSLIFLPFVLMSFADS